MLSNLPMWRDLRYAFRSLRHSPGFAAVAIVSLALGIGANAAIFALANGLILRPLAVPDPGHLVAVESQMRGEEGNGLFAATGLSYPDFKDLRDRSRSFAGLTASQSRFFGFATERNALAKTKFGELVTGDFFRVLEVAPMLGRGFRPDEDKVLGRDAVVVLSYGLWKDEFASDPHAVGRTVFLNTVPFTVIGVAPESFTGSQAALMSALYVPLSTAPLLGADPKQATANLQNRDARNLDVLGRMKPGVNLASAAAEARVISRELADAYPKTNRSSSLLVETQLRARIRQDSYDAILSVFLLALSAVVLLIACANVMNLMLSRARGRAREIAVRLAIGAGRSRLVRQLLIESLVIAIAGGALGVLFSQAGVDLFSKIHAATDVPVNLDFHLEPRVLWFTLLVSMGSAVIFGLAPALQSTRPDLVPALKSGRAEGGKRRRFLGRNLLVIAQVAGSLVLLVFASQAYRGAAILLASPLGFRTDHLLFAGFNPSLARYQPERTQAFYKKLLDGARDLTGIRAAALAGTAPLFPGNLGSSRVAPEGFRLPPGAEALDVLSNNVTDGYFAAVGLSLVAGREFQVTDTADSPRVAIVNEQFARKYFPNQNAVGKRFRLFDVEGHPSVEIIGVAKQSKYVFPAEPPLEYIYLPFSQNPQARMTMLLYTAGPSSEMAEPLRNLVRSLDRSQPIVSLRTMENFYDERARTTMNVLIETIGGLGLLGLALALVGLYGLMSYSVGLRQREIGIRMAIGANQSGVRRMVLKQGLGLSATGCAIGLTLSLIAGRPATAFIGSSYFYLPLVALVVAALLAVSALSAYLPARRASQLDPNLILRQD